MLFSDQNTNTTCLSDCNAGSNVLIKIKFFDRNFVGMSFFNDLIIKMANLLVKKLSNI